MTQPKDDLSAEHIRAILDYDPETGIFRWRHNPNRPKKWNTRRAGQIAGGLTNGYVTIRIEDCGLYQAQRLAVLHVTGEWPSHGVDHENRDAADNRWTNLRPATQGENLRNKRKQSNNSSGFIGVRFRPHHGKWEGRITRDRKTVWRAYFDSAQEAAAGRREVLRQHHGAFTLKGEG